MTDTIQELDFRGKSLKRILAYVDEQKIATPSQMVKDLHIKYSSVLSALEFLQTMKAVQIISNGKTTLIMRSAS